MSKNLTNAAVTEFDSEVKHEYQGMKTLRECVTVRTGVVGEAYKFTRMGKGLANQKASQADVTPMDISHSRQTANLGNWNAPEYTDIFDQAEVNFDERSELAQTIAKAIGRREDQIIIDTLTGGTNGGGDGFSFATTNDQDPNTGFSATVATNLTVKELRTGAKHLNDIEADENDRFCLTNAQGLDALLATTEITSSDYNSVKALVQGEVDTFLGFKFKRVGTRVEGGLPGSVGASQAYMWHKSSIGIAIGIDLKTTIDWVAQKTSWLANGMYKAGATAREPQGIVRIIYDETA